MVRTLNKEHSGRPTHAKSEGKIATVQSKIEVSLSLSVRKLAAQVDISCKTIFF